MELLIDRAAVKSDLRRDEGLRLRAYKDHLGNNTIGIGHLNVEGYTLITMEKADEIFEKDVNIAINDMLSLGIDLPKKWQEFMVKMLFQLGKTKVLKFEKMLTALRNGWWSKAKAEAKDSNWYRQTPTRVETMLAKV